MSGVPSRLPARPSLEQLRKRSKERLLQLRAENPTAKLSEAQLLVAREHGFESWPKLVHAVAAADPRASEPRIVSPVSRLLGTRDRDRAIAFWRDVLGFEVHEPTGDDGVVDLVRDRARIRLGSQDWAPDFSGDPQPPGTGIVFFETNNLEAMRTAIAGRGGDPGAAEKVNAIKMRVFEIRDPDGHVIWFGQSYQERSAPRRRRMVERVMPAMPFDDVARGIAHYRDVLGFSVNYAQADLAVLDRDHARVLLIARTAQHSGISSAYFYVRDVDALYLELLGRGAEVEGQPISQPWGLREFTLLDPERNQLTFGQPFE